MVASATIPASAQPSILSIIIKNTIYEIIVTIRIRRFIFILTSLISCYSDAVQNLSLKALHFLSFFRFHMIVSAEMKHTVSY